MSLGYLSAIRGLGTSRDFVGAQDVSPVTRAVQGAGSALLTLFKSSAPPAQRVCPAGYVNDPINPGNCVPAAVAGPAVATSPYPFGWSLGTTVAVGGVGLLALVLVARGMRK